jgi:hypothetical protein
MMRSAPGRGLTVAAMAATVAVTIATPRSQAPAFAARIAALSEPGGYFDTDNLISNERSYLHVVSDLTARRVRGGAYVGVGPDQNFSYIAAVRPSIAFIVDIRRDNLLLHLLFKALFDLAPTRVEYLALLTGRPPPSPLAGWDATAIDGIVAYLDRTPPAAPAAIEALRARVRGRLQAFGVPLSAADLATIARFHQRFIDAGLSLQFNSSGRAPQRGYPTYRDLARERDRDGAQRSFLAAEDAFQFVRTLQAGDRVVPVVGDLSGPTAVAAIGATLARENLRLSAFYVSNVEFYLFRDGTFGRFVANLGRLPLAPHAVVIRSVFGGAGEPLPGYLSASLLHPARALLDGYARGGLRQYRELTIAR